MYNTSDTSKKSEKGDEKCRFQNTTSFREAERRYKWSRAPIRTPKGKALKALKQTHDEVDMSDVVDIRILKNNSEANRSLLREINLSHALDNDSGRCLSNDGSSLPENVKCFAFDGVPGLYLFPSCISEDRQAQLCKEAILQYGNSEKYPNVLSTHVKNPIQTRCYQPPMRWATIGFNYEWTTKSYHKDNYAPFPSTVRNTMESLAKSVFLAESLDEKIDPAQKIGQPAIYQPQSGIVNFFPVGTAMMSHQDAAEEALTQPLLSLSLGCPCIFLMGTCSMEDTPFAFLLRSGDLAAFAGPARLCFHSVPRILDDCPSYLTISQLTSKEEQRYDNFCYDLRKSTTQTSRDEMESEDPSNPLELSPSVSPVKRNKVETLPLKTDFQIDPTNMSEEDKERYWRLVMKHMRININARQVYPESCDFLFT